MEPAWNVGDRGSANGLAEAATGVLMLIGATLHPCADQGIETVSGDLSARQAQLPTTTSSIHGTLEVLYADSRRA